MFLQLPFPRTQSLLPGLRLHYLFRVSTLHQTPLAEDHNLIKVSEPFGVRLQDYNLGNAPNNGWKIGFQRMLEYSMCIIHDLCPKDSNWNGFPQSFSQSQAARVLPLKSGPKSKRSNKAMAVGASTAPKGSSNNMSSAPKWYAALAIAILARWPPESATPRLPIGTWSPMGNIFKSFSKEAAWIAAL